MIEAIVFDFYGVLGLNGWQTFKVQHFSDRPAAWEPLRQLGQRVDAGEATEEAFVAALARETGETPQTIRYQFEHTQLNQKLLDFIADELKDDYKIGLLSNASHDVFQRLLGETQQALFDVMISSYDVGFTKPDRRMFELVCRQLGVEPSASLMVDDKVQHVHAAASIDMRALQYVSTQQTIHDIRKVLTA